MFANAYLFISLVKSLISEVAGCRVDPHFHDERSSNLLEFFPSARFLPFFYRGPAVILLWPTL